MDNIYLSGNDVITAYVNKGKNLNFNANLVNVYEEAMFIVKNLPVVELPLEKEFMIDGLLIKTSYFMGRYRFYIKSVVEDTIKDILKDMIILGIKKKNPDDPNSFLSLDNPDDKLFAGYYLIDAKINYIKFKEWMIIVDKLLVSMKNG